MSDVNDADDLLVARARDRLAKHRECELLASLLAELRERRRPWWSTSVLKKTWPTPVRFLWLDQRPDVRARLTHELTGLAQRAARESERGFQAELIERVVDAGDVALDDWERAFTVEDLAVHAPASVIWQEFRARFPWSSPDEGDRELMVWLLGELLDEKRHPVNGTPAGTAGNTGGSIMTPLYVRSAIDVKVWQEHLPLDIRVQVDGRRLRKELEGKTFNCRDELAVVKLDRLVEHIPAVHLRGIFDALERVLPALASPVEPTAEDEVEHTESMPKDKDKKNKDKDVDAH